MPNASLWLIWVLAAYLAGATPFGWLIAKARGVDIRKSGSGNIGATNVGRVLGRRVDMRCWDNDRTCRMDMRWCECKTAPGVFTGG